MPDEHLLTTLLYPAYFVKKKEEIWCSSFSKQKIARGKFVQFNIYNVQFHRAIVLFLVNISTVPVARG